MAFEPTAVLGPQNRNPFSGPASLAAQQPGPLDRMNEDKYRQIDVWIKVIGLVSLLGSGWFGWHQYQGLREREFKRTFYEQQVATVSGVFDALSRIDNAQTKEGKKAAIEQFWMIYQGRARTFLDPRMFQALSLPAEYVSGCVMKIRKPKIIQDCNNFTASMSAAGFARVARKQLSLGWNLSFKEIANEDPWSPPK